MDDSVPKKSYAALVAGLICGGALLLASVAAVGAFAIVAREAEPARQVAAFLGALEHGEASKALKLDGIAATPSDVLLTDKAYRAATNRITGFAIGRTVTQGDRATVAAVYSEGGEHRPVTLTLHRTGRLLLVIDQWRLEPVALATARVHVDAPPIPVTLAGASARVVHNQVSSRAFPGQYPVEVGDAKGMQWYDIGGGDISISGFGGAADDSTELTAGLTQEGNAAAFAAVNKWIDGCAASTALQPPGCSFGMSSEGLSGVTLTQRKWTLESRPSFTVGSWMGSGWAVTMLEPGSATFSAHATEGGASGTLTSAGRIPVKVGGIITFGDHGAVFTSLHWYTPSELQNLGTTGA